MGIQGTKWQRGPRRGPAASNQHTTLTDSLHARRRATPPETRESKATANSTPAATAEKVQHHASEISEESQFGNGEAEARCDKTFH